eukprot:365288-Chlamydomonas_euryale.AAC.6
MHGWLRHSKGTNTPRRLPGSGAPASVHVDTARAAAAPVARGNAWMAQTQQRHKHPQTLARVQKGDVGRRLCGMSMHNGIKNNPRPQQAVSCRFGQAVRLCVKGGWVSDRTHRLC